MSDFAAAFCVGVGQVTIGHPFDKITENGLVYN